MPQQKVVTEQYVKRSAMKFFINLIIPSLSLEKTNVTLALVPNMATLTRAAFNPILKQRMRQELKKLKIRRMQI